MPITNNLVLETTITNAGGTITLDVGHPYTMYVFKGSPTLSSNCTITSSGTPSLGMEFRMLFRTAFGASSNTLTIFGLPVSNDLVGSSFDATATYNGSSWDVIINPTFGDLPIITGDMIQFTTINSGNIDNDAITTIAILDEAVTAAKLASDSVTTVKVADGAITAAKADSNFKKEVIVVPISFENNEQAGNIITIPYNCTINSITYGITKALAGTDAGIITLSINGSPMTPNTISIPASTAINSTASTTITSNNSVTANQTIKFETSKTTPGGKGLLSVHISRS